jgi:hypothetical protein
MIRRTSEITITMIATAVGLFAFQATARSSNSSNFQAVESADVIVTGFVTDVSEIRRSTLTLRGGAVVESQIMQAHVQVDRVLKGDVPDRKLTVRFEVPLRESFGYRGLEASSYRIVFLNKPHTTDPYYRLAVPLFPSLPALREGAAPGATVEDSVIAEVAKVIASPVAGWQERREAMFSLQFLPGTMIIDALKAALLDPDARVSNFAAASLLLHNDITGMGTAERLLLGESHGQLREDDRSNLLAGITYGIHSAQAVDPLKHLLESPDAEIRKAAASGLGNTGALIAKPLLVKALDDPDPHVRFAASNGLANLLGEPTWRQLSFNEFAKAERQYIQHWKNPVPSP